MVSTEAIQELIEPALTADGLELWDVEVSQQLVRILVDRPGGVDLDALASLANRVISPILDQHPELTPGGRYQLEVSSPGVERRLRTLEQYRRYIGAEVAIKTLSPVGGARRHQGTLISVDEQRVCLVPEAASADDPIEIPHDQIDRARTVLVWGPRAGQEKRRPGASRRPSPSKTAAADLKDAG